MNLSLGGAFDSISFVCFSWHEPPLRNVVPREGTTPMNGGSCRPNFGNLNDTALDSSFRKRTRGKRKCFFLENLGLGHELPVWSVSEMVFGFWFESRVFIENWKWVSKGCGSYLIHPGKPLTFESRVFIENWKWVSKGCGSYLIHPGKPLTFVIPPHS